MFRGRTICVWPGCGALRLVEAGNFRCKEARGWLCDAHTNDMALMTGSRKVTRRKIEFINGGDLEHNRLTWSFVKFAVFDQDKGLCRTCRVVLSFTNRPIEFHVDHITPVWQGGKTNLANLQLLCVGCHKAKSASEQKLVNQHRWQHRLGVHAHRLTHMEKDALIAKLIARVRELENPGDRSVIDHG